MPHEHPFTQTVDLLDLPRWSPWPARLLGVEEWKRKPRTLEKLEQEYDREKYASCLQYLEEHPGATAEDIRMFEFGGSMDREVCVSCGDQLYKVTLLDAWHYQNDLLLSLMTPWIQGADVVCELGSGFGYQLSLLRDHFPDKRYVGLDLSANAVRIAEKLSGDITVQQCDLGSPDLQFPFDKKQKIFFFSFYCYDNFPSVTSALDRLITIKGQAWRFCFFEPVFAWCGDDTLGLLRKAYTVASDYNRDLLEAVASHKNLTIDGQEKNLFGINALHPFSMLCWH